MNIAHMTQRLAGCHGTSCAMHQGKGCDCGAVIDQFGGNTMTTKTCLNCEHRQGSGMFAKCSRTGYYNSVEMAFGGRCAGPREGILKMILWEPRRTFWMRITGQYYEAKS